ncbi:hypothetical protein F7734_24935 [Scytonema sp. UIC 10036]|uniref:hypothetical protein n=1 Tax=Scytonema sp. UIC 10036 TaxID=2304196 RepID=UPI0012DA23CD|nr:hypothetical protein [Scytonema sp. UIC 10036]MUG95430.1 hypothetical protein [Scytonema sp. UIC 10036]
MLRLYHVLLGALVVSVLTPLGLIQAFSKFSAAHKSQQPAVVQGSAANSQATQGNIWKTILGKTSAPSGWSVSPCEGTAPLLCVSSQEKVLGTVEMGVYPLDKLPNFQKMLVQVGIPANSKIDYQDPKNQNQVTSALKLWTSEHYSVLAKDRKGEYSNKITFSSQPPQTVQVGKLKGVYYGFAGLKKQGGSHEEHRGYVAFDGKALYVITTAFDTASATGKFDKVENFRNFEPHMPVIVQGVKLPK